MSDQPTEMETTEPDSISGILDTVFSQDTSEKETTSGEVTSEAGERGTSRILDEETFEPLETPGMSISAPTAEEIAEHPELEYSSKEIKAIVKTLDKEQWQQFREYEAYFLSRFRKTGNMLPLHLEIRKIVRDMCS